MVFDFIIFFLAVLYNMLILKYNNNNNKSEYMLFQHVIINFNSNKLVLLELDIPPKQFNNFYTRSERIQINQNKKKSKQ